MSADNQSVKTGWSSVQVYSMAAICLLIGITVGYLFRGSTAPRSAVTATAPPTTTAPSTTTPGAATQAGSSTQQPTPADMKRMAEKQVAPLLEQLKKNPKDADVLAKIGYYYMISSMYGDAATYYEKSAELKPNPAVYTTLASAQAYSGNMDKAITSLDHALQLDPKYADALFNLGMLKWRAKGDVKGAIACWEKLVKTNPHHPQLDKVKQLIAHVEQQQEAQHSAVAQ